MDLIDILRIYLSTYIVHKTILQTPRATKIQLIDLILRIRIVNMCHYSVNHFKAEKFFFYHFVKQKIANFRAENDIFRFLSTIFKNVNFLHFSAVHQVTTSSIFKKIFGFLVSDHFFENYHARSFASRSRDGWTSAPKTPIFVALLVCKILFCPPYTES